MAAIWKMAAILSAILNFRVANELLYESGPLLTYMPSFMLVSLSA